ncbi:MAG: hypothetical protein NT051_03435 [Candidatus Micrarchaeota archaeon]|nr:hypothetical protein [Candidatus Micrarchaeota archaeon]
MTADLATAKSYKALVLTEKALNAFNKFRHSDVLAEKIHALQQERVVRIKIKEKAYSIESMKLTEKLELPPGSEKPRDYDQIEAHAEIGELYFKLAGIYQARGNPRSKAGRLAETHIQNYLVSKAVENVMEAAEGAARKVDGIKNLSKEVDYKKKARGMLNENKGWRSLKLYSLKAELETEVPILQKELKSLFENQIFQPRRGN